MIKLSGTVYRFHPLFVILMVLSLLTGYLLELITLFGIVLIHEMGHVYAAKTFGWRVTEVRLLPIGGVAVVEEAGNVPVYQEIWVTLAGPLQNAWMVLLSLLMLAVGWGEEEWWNYFLQANLLVGAFNLLPILPLDGGKLLQSFLSCGVSYHRTLAVTTQVSLWMSALLIAAALFPWYGTGIQLNLLLIGAFLLYSNWYHYRHLPFYYLRFLMSRRARFAAAQGEQQLDKGEPLLVSRRHRIAEVLKMFHREKYHWIYVVSDQGKVQYILPEQRLIDYFFNGHKTNGAVSDLIV
ncbi:M50 family metallopeptidase [Paenibacillus senegalensis]|uniref:M50 family metallopeptidase n=1 Tax=Paenibacillus senegalensis TaxID=1465766 RepID=UPI000289F4D0|nr:M50 family metallopeptidase [Paenibacillus senegalensis]